MLHQRDPILLLFSWGIYVRDEKRDIVTANQRHEARIVEMAHVRLRLPAICGGVRILAFLNHLLGDFGPVLSRGAFTCRINPVANCVNLILREYLDGIVEMRSIAGRGLMTMVEVAVKAHMDIAPAVVKLDELIDRNKGYVLI